MVTKIKYMLNVSAVKDGLEYKEGVLLGWVNEPPPPIFNPPPVINNGGAAVYTVYASTPPVSITCALIGLDDGLIIKVPYYHCRYVSDED